MQMWLKQAFRQGVGLKQKKGRKERKETNSVCFTEFCNIILREILIIFSGFAGFVFSVITWTQTQVGCLILNPLYSSQNQKKDSGLHLKTSNITPAAVYY